MCILVAARNHDDVPNYLASLDAVEVEYSVSLQATDENALLLPGGCDVDPVFYHEPNTSSVSIDAELDHAQLVLISHFLTARKPIFGICRGCQLLNVALGGTLIQNLNTPISHTSFAYQGKRQDQRHIVKCSSNSLMYPLYGSEFYVNSAHHQACDKIGTDLVVTLRAEDGTVEAIEHKYLPIFAVQWHPERLHGAQSFSTAADGKLLFQYFVQIIQNSL